MNTNKNIKNNNQFFDKNSKNNKTTKSKQKVLFAIDVKTNGPNYTTNSIISIGYCYGTLGGKVMMNERINLKYNPNTFDEWTYNKFWKKHLDKLDVLKENVVSVEEGMKKFIKIIDDLEDKYNVIILSDNPVFDIGWINHYLRQVLYRGPLYYKKDGQSFRFIYDTDCFIRGALGMDYKIMFTPHKKLKEEYSLDIKTKHSVLPDKDAIYIYELHTELLKKMSDKDHMIIEVESIGDEEEDRLGDMDWDDLYDNFPENQSYIPNYIFNEISKYYNCFIKFINEL